MSKSLEECKEELEMYVTQPLVVPEVRKDMLPRTAVTVDFLKVISEHLEKQCKTTLNIAPEACQGSEDLKGLFYYLAYHALQAEHDQMNLRINNLKKTLKEVPKDDEEEFANLMLLQKRRKDLVDKLEKWRPRFPAVSFSLFDLDKVRTLKEPVVLRVDSTIYWINLYPLDYGPVHKLIAGNFSSNFFSSQEPFLCCEQLFHPEQLAFFLNILLFISLADLSSQRLCLFREEDGGE